MDTIPPDVCTDITYLNSVQQKNRFQLFNIPANRYDNLANSPYNKINPKTGQPYTKFDLDMRRKAEILKYNSNRMSTQTNNLTKAQKFAQAVNGYSQQSTLSQAFIAANTLDNIVNTCPPGTIVKTPSSASDVPGGLLLYDDPTIPLYNLVNETTTASYGIINQLQNPYQSGFQYSNQTNVIYNGESPASLFTIYMFNTPSNTYNFSFTAPILIQFFGEVNSTTLPPVGSKNTFQIALNSLAVNVNYSLSPMKLNSTISYKINNTATNPMPILLDVSANPQVSSFNGSYYLGTITVSNIVLPVALGYIYDFQLTANFSPIYPSNSDYTIYYKAPEFSSVFNVTSSITPSKTNCSINPNTPVVVPPGTPFGTFSVSGTEDVP